MCAYQEDGRHSQNSSALDDANQDHNDGDHEEDVNEPTHGVRSYKAKRPKYEKNDGNCPQHGVSSYETRLGVGRGGCNLGVCHNMCEMACVASREISCGFALYWAALSKTVRISSPSGTVWMGSALMSCHLSLDSRSTYSSLYSSFRAIY